MGDLQNTSAEGTQTSTEGIQQNGKTFTQDDVNRIVQERLAKEKSKTQTADENDARMAELDKREAELKAKEQRFTVLSAVREAGYPDELADVIRGDNENDLKKSLETINKIIEERTPRGWSKELEDKRSRIVFTAPIHSLPNDTGIRSAMGLRG